MMWSCQFFEWCIKNDLLINSEKCKCILFYCQNNKFIFLYTINGLSFHYSTTMRDLDVLLSSILSFNAHVDTIHSKVLLLGLLNVVWILKIFAKRYYVDL